MRPAKHLTTVGTTSRYRYLPTNDGGDGVGWDPNKRALPCSRCPLLGYSSRGTGAVEVPVLPTIEARGGVRWDPISSPECERRSTRSLIAPFDGEWGGRNHKRVGPPAAEAANP